MKDSDATHKARFRCVLAKAPDIEYRKDLSNNDTEPYRSYRMKTFEGRQSCVSNFFWKISSIFVVCKEHIDILVDIYISSNIWQRESLLD